MEVPVDLNCHIGALVTLVALATSACDISDPYEDACNNQDTQCKDKDAKTLNNGQLGSAPACNKYRFDGYKNGIEVSNCVRDAKSCLDALTCYGHAQAK